MSFNSNPDITDWDEDGKKDMIIGEHDPVPPNSGTIRLYMNNGTNAVPVFGDYSMLEAGGSQIYRYRADPRIFDLDQDGLKDLLVGEYDGNVYFYKNVGTNNAPVFDASFDTLRTTGGFRVNVTSSSRLHCVDWTDDGDIDIIISGIDGYVVLYENAMVGIQETVQKKDVQYFSIRPNPIVNRAVCEYRVNEASDVEINLYSADGRFLATLLRRHADSGMLRFTWNVSDDLGGKLAAGVYFIELKTNAERITRRVIVVK